MGLSVVFADDNYLVRDGISALLTEAEDIELVETVTDPPSLLRAVAEHQPDAVLTDIRMPPSCTTEGIDAAKRIRAEYPQTGVVVLSQCVEEDYAFELLCDRVAGLGYLLARKSRESRSPLLGLTERELEVLQSMATGRTNSATAKALYMSERAVEKHVGSVFKKAWPRGRVRDEPPSHGSPGLPRSDWREPRPVIPRPPSRRRWIGRAAPVRWADGVRVLARRANPWREDKLGARGAHATLLRAAANAGTVAKSLTPSRRTGSGLAA